MKKSIGLVGALTIGLGVALAAPATANAADTGTIYVPDDINFSETRADGHWELTEDGGLRVYTESNTTTDKVAGYIATSTPLAGLGESSLELTNNTDGTIPPGYQLAVDFDGNDTVDGILVGEGAYGDNWWLSTSAQQFVKDGAPHSGGGNGSGHFGTLAEWSGAFQDANVLAFGFSLGSGVKGDWTIESITFDDTRYTFAEHTVLASKDDCKSGGWATSTKPVFKNQGQCVSSFASTKSKLSNFSI